MRACVHTHARGTRKRDVTWTVIRYAANQLLTKWIPDVSRDLTRAIPEYRREFARIRLRHEEYPQIRLDSLAGHFKQECVSDV